ncbi:alkaline phosphatase D family protein [Bacillus sp. F19]|nr:alkaline phosphatase D family protein [Bacillus sp. F19]
MDRRYFLQASSKVAALTVGLTIANSLFGNSTQAAEPEFNSYPFTLGVASGDPLPDGVVLWTRIAPDPLNGGGMKAYDVPVRWEVSADEGFRQIVKHGVEFARHQLGHSVHVEVEGLDPNSIYYYRFKVGSDMSPVGRTKTLPAFNTDVSRMTFAFASCQNWQIGYYTAFKHMAQEDLDLVIHLGDYIYEGGISNDGVRPHNSDEIRTLEDYRNRYALYKSDTNLQAAHAAFPWVVTMDDHEVDNNFAGLIPSTYEPVEQFIKRRADAYQAYYEHMPLRRSSLPDGEGMQLYRRLAVGHLVDFHVLDTRQYRDDQANGDGRDEPNAESMDPNRSLTGDEQERWILDGLSQSKTRWHVLAQQVFFAERDFKDGEGEEVSMDAWDGYSANRERILNFIKDNGISNFVVLTGDVHNSWANEIKSDFKDQNSANLGVEFVGTSISSGGDGSDINNTTPVILAENPHIKFFNNYRGYVRCTVTPETWTTDYRVVPYVRRPDAPIATRATFIVENGKNELKKIYDVPLTVTSQ